MSDGLVLILAIMGIAMFLIFEHPLIFWLIGLPLFLLIVISLLYWIFK